MMKKVVDLLKSAGLGIIVLVLIAAIFGGNSKDDKGSSASTDAPAAEASATSEDTKAEAKADAKAATQSETKADAKKTEAKKEEAKKEEAKDEGPKIAENAKYKVEIGDYSIEEDYDGAPVIAINYTFTNVSDDSPSSMQMSTNISVYQDGVECEDAYFAGVNSDGYSNKVKAGVSVDVTRAYKLQNTSSDVEVEVGQLFSFSKDLLAYKTFKLS